MCLGLLAKRDRPGHWGLLPGLERIWVVLLAGLGRRMAYGDEASSATEQTDLGA